MTDVTYYLVDSDLIWTGKTLILDDMKPAPKGAIYTDAVPQPNQKWTKRGWANVDHNVIRIQSKKTKMIKMVDAMRDKILTSGFPYNFGSPHGLQRLQTRDVEDSINWLVAKSSYLDAINNGMGQVEGATIRTTANINITMNFIQAYEVLVTMSQWGATVYNNSWSLKDAISRADSLDTLNSIDITQGWP
jgi:hypothetical protein